MRQNQNKDRSVEKKNTWEVHEQIILNKTYPREVPETNKAYTPENCPQTRRISFLWINIQKLKVVSINSVYLSRMSFARWKSALVGHWRHSGTRTGWACVSVWVSIRLPWLQGLSSFSPPTSDTAGHSVFCFPFNCLCFSAKILIIYYTNHYNSYTYISLVTIGKKSFISWVVLFFKKIQPFHFT